ncbi:MAG TPA: FAD:protein FMN transferase [Solirubrobacteraceae bacterium]|jgi:thiamine biosynthesis lipoprotein|nr:FAD:protein FMN transferase [Solirubrobacteraceae bacterium]
MSAQLARTKWQALGTSVELLVSNGDALAQARAILELQLDEVDRACSRFRDDSELMRVNARAGCTVQVGALLIEAVELALRAAELTDGDVDPTVGAALVLAGYDRDIHLLDCISPAIGNAHTRPCPPPAVAPRVRATLLAGWRAVDLDRKRCTLRIPRGVKLDLGATAKAWAADRAAVAIHEAVGCGVLVNLGGDISTAGPAPNEEPHGQTARAGWQIHVTDDHRSAADAPGQTISIAGGGLATSSTTVRRWRHREQTMHHIIDPASGAPAEEVWRTVSVAASDCADANIAATAAIVRGAGAPEWLAGLGLPARLVCHDGEVLTVGAWPTEDEAR